MSDNGPLGHILTQHLDAMARATKTVTPTAPDQWTYKGWSISYDLPPIPDRSMDWSATSPDYDCDCDQDGVFCCSGSQVHAATYKDLLVEIEDAIAAGDGQ